MYWLTPQGNCTHPEDMKLCTVIMKSNGSFPVNRRRMVSAQVRDPNATIFLPPVDSTVPDAETSLAISREKCLLAPYFASTESTFTSHTSKYGCSEIPQFCKDRSTEAYMTHPCNLVQVTIGAISTSQTRDNRSISTSQTCDKRSYFYFPKTCHAFCHLIKSSCDPGK